MVSNHHSNLEAKKEARKTKTDQTKEREEFQRKKKKKRTKNSISKRINILELIKKKSLTFCVVACHSGICKM